MSSSYDINISEIEYNAPNELEYSNLTLGFTGKDVNEVLINTLRRIMLNDIPTYAFAPECMIIEKNTSVFNNDQIRVHMMQLPILNVPLDISYLDEKYWLDVDYNSMEREHVKDEKNIELYINVVNNEDNIKQITTNDIEFYVEHELAQSNYSKKNPILLLKLRPLESFNCRMKAVIGVGERNAIWSGAGNAYFNIEHDSALLYIESNGQMSEYELLWKACRCMQQRLIDIKKIILTKFNDVIMQNTQMQTVELTIDNESHTVGNILARTLQDMHDVEYAGTGKKNELVKQITIKVIYKKVMQNPFDPIMAAIDKIMDEMNFIEKKVHKLGSKYINNYDEPHHNDSKTDDTKKISKSNKKSSNKKHI